MVTRYTIGIDCAPGHQRPGDFIEQVIDGTGLPSKETISRSFGAWVWDYSDVDNIETLWQLHSSTIFDRLETLNNSGHIRGARITPKKIPRVSDGH